MHVQWRTFAVLVTAIFVMLNRVVVRSGCMQMRMRTSHFNRYQIHLPMTHATLCDQR